MLSKAEKKLYSNLSKVSSRLKILCLSNLDEAKPRGEKPVQSNLSCNILILTLKRSINPVSMGENRFVFSPFQVSNSQYHY